MPKKPKTRLLTLAAQPGAGVAARTYQASTGARKVWLFRAGGVLVLGCAAYWSVRLAWADHLGRSEDLNSRERATRLAPRSATLYERLAEKREDLGGDPLPDLECAAGLDAASARRFERLGQGAELAGDFALAERSLLRAAELSRLYQPRYLLAQYYFRRRDAAGWERWSREAFASAYGDVTPLLELARRLAPDAETLARQATAERADVARQFLLFLVRNRQIPAAAGLAQHLAETGGAADLPALFGYCEQALAEANAAPAIQVWNTLCRRKLLPYAPLDVSPLTNGDFAYPATGNAFDWHLEPPAGARAAQGRKSLRIALTGSQPENCVLAWQYVPLRRGAFYRLRFAGATGLGWSVFYPSAGGWSEMPAARPFSFQAPAEVIRLALMYRRPSGSPRLAGEVAVTGVRLEVQP